MTMLESQVRAIEIRRRLFNPVGGRPSTELDITSESVARRLRFERDARDKAQHRQARIAELVELLATYSAELKKLRSEAFPGQLTDPNAPPTLTQILTVVSDFYFVPIIHILSKRHTKCTVGPRHVVMFLARQLTLLSLPEIGKRMGGRDHTTVMNAVRKITERSALDVELAGEIAEIKHRIELKRMETAE
jgi:chromosomal replication initiation ATPase DnaA